MNPCFTLLGFLPMMSAASNAPVAQMDRVLPSEGSGRGFESRQAHHLHYLICSNLILYDMKALQMQGFFIACMVWYKLIRTHTVLTFLYPGVYPEI